MTFRIERTESSETVITLDDDEGVRATKIKERESDDWGPATVTWSSPGAVDPDTAERFALAILEAVFHARRLDANVDAAEPRPSVRVVDVVGNTSYYRDGGSYGMHFIGQDGKKYELFVKSTMFAKPKPAESHFPPVVRLGGGSDAVVVQTLTWREAQRLLASVAGKDELFDQMLRVIRNEGRTTSNS